MRNIFLLPTDKPSRLYGETNNNLVITTKPMLSISVNRNLKNWNIYITSQEKIKKDDYVVQTNFEKTITQIIKCETVAQVLVANNKNGSFTKNKIILTNDPELIKNGVQEIDNSFLEWYVNNSDCEFVEVEKESRCCGRCDGNYDLCVADMICESHNVLGCEKCYGLIDSYKVIIPQKEISQQEKSKLLSQFEILNGCSSNEFDEKDWIKFDRFYERQTLKDNDEWLSPMRQFKIKDIVDSSKVLKDKVRTLMNKEPKQETVEEAAEKYLLSSVERNQYGDELSFIDGAKWVQEKFAKDIRRKNDEIELVKVKLLHTEILSKAFKYTEEDLLDLVMSLEVPKNKRHIKEVEQFLKNWIAAKK